MQRVSLTGDSRNAEQKSKRLWGRVFGPQEGPPGPSLQPISFCKGKHGQRLLVNTYLVHTYPEQNEPEV